MPILRFIQRHSILTIIAVLVLVLVASYVSGYRLGAGFSIIRVGTLVVENVPEGTAVYVDGAARGSGKSLPIEISLLPGNHAVIVDAKNMWPWNEIVEIRSSERTVIQPLLVGTAVAGRLLEADEKKAALAAIAAYELPSDETPLLLSDGCLLVSVSENRIIAGPSAREGCVSPEFLCTDGSCESTIAYAPLDTLRAVIPYPNRSDALVIALGNSLYALEIDPRDPRFFAPVLSGTEPRAALGETDAIVVKDSDSVFELSL